VARERRIEPDHVLHQRALAAARAAEDAEHLAAAHDEVDVVEDLRRLVARVDVLDADDDVARRCRCASVGAHMSVPKGRPRD
jgi:hypothetical protein